MVRRRPLLWCALAAAAARCGGWRGAYLFSEVFVVKPAGSATEFAWHRDDTKQLAALGGGARRGLLFLGGV